MSKNTFETWLPKLVVTPAFVLGFAFIYGLMVWNGVLSLSASRMLPNYEWVGLAQYEKLWEMDRWWVALKNLGIFGVGYVGGSLAIGVVLAVLLDQKIRAEGALRTIYLYPMALSFVVTGTAWKWLLNPGMGLEKLVRDWGFTNFEFGWLVDTDMAIYCVVIAAVWQTSGFAMALFLAGLRGVDSEQIHAARLDGARTWQVYWRIILPQLGPVFVSAFVILAHMAIKSYDLVIALTNGGPGRSTWLPSVFMYQYSFTRNEMAVGAASSVLMLLAVGAIVLPYLWGAMRSAGGRHD